jgi:hypothetical protein
MSPSDAPTGTGRVPPALRQDVPVAVLLVGSWLALGAGGLAHVVVGLVFVAVAARHLATRPVSPAALGRAVRDRTREASDRRRAAASVTLVTVAALMTVSGLLQWAGVTAAVPVHVATSALTIVVAAGHVWRRRAALKARGRPRSRCRAAPAAGTGA